MSAKHWVDSWGTCPTCGRQGFLDVHECGSKWLVFDMDNYAGFEEAYDFDKVQYAKTEKLATEFYFIATDDMTGRREITVAVIPYVIVEQYVSDLEDGRFDNDPDMKVRALEIVGKATKYFSVVCEMEPRYTANEIMKGENNGTTDVR